MVNTEVRLTMFFGAKSGEFSSVQLCSNLCDSMDSSKPGLPVHHQLIEFTQTHIHWVGDAIHPPHPLLSPPPTFNLSQHQGLFKWVSTSHQVAKVLGVSASASVNEYFSEYSGLIFFRMEWLDLLSVQGILKSFLQHHSATTSALSFLYSLTLTSIHDYWKSHSFD